MPLSSWQKNATDLIDIIPEVFYEKEYNVIQTRAEYYVLFQVFAEPLQLLHAHEIEQVLDDLALSYRVMSFPTKLCVSTSLLDARPPLEHLQMQLADADGKRAEHIKMEIDNMLGLEKVSVVKEYRFKIFGEDVQDVLKNAYVFEKGFPFVAVSQNLAQIESYLRFEHNPLEKRRKENK